MQDSAAACLPAATATIELGDFRSTQRERVGSRQLQNSEHPTNDDRDDVRNGGGENAAATESDSQAAVRPGPDTGINSNQTTTDPAAFKGAVTDIDEDVEDDGSACFNEIAAENFQLFTDEVWKLVLERWLAKHTPNTCARGAQTSLLIASATMMWASVRFGAGTFLGLGPSLETEFWHAYVPFRALVRTWGFLGFALLAVGKIAGWTVGILLHLVINMCMFVALLGL